MRWYINESPCIIAMFKVAPELHSHVSRTLLMDCLCELDTRLRTIAVLLVKSCNNLEGWRASKCRKMVCRWFCGSRVICSWSHSHTVCLQGTLPGSCLPVKRQSWIEKHERHLWIWWRGTCPLSPIDLSRSTASNVHIGSRFHLQKVCRLLNVIDCKNSSECHSQLPWEFNYAEAGCLSSTLVSWNV